MKLIITQKGIILNYDKLVKEITMPKVNQMLRCLSFTNRRRAGRRVVYKKAHFYKIIALPNGDKILSIARSAYFQNHRGFRRFLPEHQVVNKLPQGEKISRRKFPGEEEFMLYDFQQVVHDYLMENVFNRTQVKRGNAGITLVMDTGLGKSYLAGAVFRTLGLKTLYITANLGLVEQMREKPFNAFPDITIGEYHSKKKLDGDIVFTTPQSVQKPEFIFGRGKSKTAIPSQEYLKRFGLVIFDETPEYLGEKVRNLYWKLNCKYMLGLTATPDEHMDKMDVIYKLHIGPLLKATDIEGFDIKDVKWKVKVQAVRYHGLPRYTQRLVNETTGDLSTNLMDTQFASDPNRRKMVLALLKQLYKAKKNIFIFANQRKHLESLYEDIISAGIFAVLDAPETNESTIPNTEHPSKKDITKLMGGSNRSDVDQAEQTSRIILTTYRYGSVGMSIVKMDCIIFYTPRRSKMRQIVGRILRRGGDPSKTRYIVDIIDANTSLINQYSTRKKVYVEKDFKIIERTVFAHKRKAKKTPEEN